MGDWTPQWPPPVFRVWSDSDHVWVGVFPSLAGAISFAEQTGGPYDTYRVMQSRAPAQGHIEMCRTIPRHRPGEGVT